MEWRPCRDARKVDALPVGYLVGPALLRRLEQGWDLVVPYETPAPGASPDGSTGTVVGRPHLTCRVVIERSTYGTGTAIRLRTHRGAVLPEAPTVLTAATAARTRQPSSLSGLVTRYAHQVNPQLSVLPGHLVAEQMSGVATWEPFAEALAASDVPVVADVGRLHAASPMLPVAARADVVVVVGRADPVSVIRMRERLTRLVAPLGAYRGSTPRLFPVLVCPARHGRAVVADLTRVLADTPAGPLLVGVGHLAIDRGAVERLEAGNNPAGRLARTPLLQSARSVVGEIDASARQQVPTVASAVLGAGDD